VRCRGREVTGSDLPTPATVQEQRDGAAGPRSAFRAAHRFALAERTALRDRDDHEQKLRRRETGVRHANPSSRSFALQQGADALHGLATGIALGNGTREFRKTHRLGHDDPVEGQRVGRQGCVKDKPCKSQQNLFEVVAFEKARIIFGTQAFDNPVNHAGKQFGLVGKALIECAL
jgi:hypothetical protein